MITAIVFLPLLAATIVGIFSNMPNRVAQGITSTATVISALLSCLMFYTVIIQGEPQVTEIMRWISSGDFNVSWTLQVDSLTAVMLVVVTIVSALVHIYSVGYMSHDASIPRFMAYLSLFTFSMLMLVTSRHFMQLFFGWEGVGLCSYLLIGFWYHKPSAKAAAMKAFIVNRVGDIGLILGIFTIYYVFGTLSFQEIFLAAPQAIDQHLNILGYSVHAITLICILLFIGAMGKSAQLGLHTWLPDAMEGPTPVSALIHAATMVTAGVFLVARCSPLFEMAPVARDIVTIVGACTACFAATIALTQNDIKRVIAYSTCSQLGYMFFACGVSAYAAGIFHLMTHGFFKALLFLGAGSVIHALSDEQDMRKMGGIWRKIPITYAMMVIGTIAIVGFPPFSGYFSKDMILETTYVAAEKGHHAAQLAFWLGSITAFLTSFYSFRLLFLTFHGKTRATDEVIHHIHESPLVMLFPLMVLAIGAMGAGWVFSEKLGIVHPDFSFWQHAIVGNSALFEEAHHIPKLIKQSPLLEGAAGLVLAYIFYIAFPSLPSLIVKYFRAIYRFLLNKWYIDELYDYLFVRPALAIGRFFWKHVDVGVVDRLGPNGMAWICTKTAARVSKMQNGLIYTYAFSMLIGLAGFIGYYLWLGYMAE